MSEGFRSGKLTFKGDKKKKKKKRTAQEAELAEEADDVLYERWWLVDDVESLRGAVILEASDEKFLMAEETGEMTTGPLDEDGPTPYHQFSMVNITGGTIGLKTCFGRFLGTDSKGEV
eukprot:Colp12_sorted_trinity150504_noHs@27247